MPATATRLWAIPLTAVLSVNILLIGLAIRHVGAAPAAKPIVAQPSPSETPQPDAEVAIAPPIADSELPESELAVCPVAEAWGEVSASIPPPVVISDLPNLAPSDPAPGAPSIDEPVNDRGSLILINPPATRGVVNFVVDGQVFRLAPGEYLRLPASALRRVRFHRGDDFGDADHGCQLGAFGFEVTEQGWTLEEVDHEAAARLLKVCSPVDTRCESDED
jgi:hypothetical protein